MLKIGHSSRAIALALCSASALSASALIGYSDFSVPTDLVILGDALHVGNVLVLNPNAPNRRGAAWHENKQVVEYGFNASFNFRIAALHNGGGDGFAFVIQNVGFNAMGASGAGVGYAGISNSIAIEFDTFENPDLMDPNANHVSIHTRGLEGNSSHENFSIGSSSAIPNISDGNVHHVDIEYHGGNLVVRVDGIPRMDARVNLRELLRLDRGSAICGFVGASGIADERHEILNWFMDVDLPGDVDGDDCVDMWDYAILAHAFGSSIGDPNFTPHADFDRDGEVNLIDYMILSQNFGKGC